MVQQQYENEMQEQVAKLLDDNFGDNFAVKDEEKDKKVKRRTPSPRAPNSKVEVLAPRSDPQQQGGNAVSGSTGAIPKTKRKEHSAETTSMEASKVLLNSKRGRARSKVRAPEIVVTPMQNK